MTKIDVKPGRAIFSLLLAAAVLPWLYAGTALGSDDAAWRSFLYPEDWQPPGPAMEGDFLHDFSWAGYRNGTDLPRLRGRAFDVVRLGADPTGRQDATEVIQKAIDQAGARGGIVSFPRGTFKIDGLLAVKKDHVILVGAGSGKTRLRFTKHVGMKSKAHLIFQGDVVHGPLLALAKDAPACATEVTLTDVGDLEKGDEIALGLVANDAFRADHGMTKYWEFSAGKWRPWFRRIIASVDRRKKTVSFTVPTRYPLKTAWEASLCVETGYLRECGLAALSICNAPDYEAAWKTSQVAAVEIADGADCWVRDVRSYAASEAEARGAHLMSCGIRVRGCKRVTVQDCVLSDAAHRGGGGNGYLFEIRSSNEVLTRDCEGLRGRHNFIQNWDFGTSGCVWLRVHSEGSLNFPHVKLPIGIPAVSEFHHALATANLVDSCCLDDGWNAFNRHAQSSGAGHTATQCVFWNVTGKGQIRSRQFGRGYIIGTGPELKLFTGLDRLEARDTEPEDLVEGKGRAETLEPRSLYEDQRRRRLKR